MSPPKLQPPVGQFIEEIRWAADVELRLLNLGDPAEWQWVLERADDLLTSQGIDV